MVPFAALRVTLLSIYPNEIPPLPYPGSRRSGRARV